MLNLLNAKWHEVLTGVAVVRVGGETRVAYEATRVRFAEMNEREIDWYIATGEPFGKAGAYGIQGKASLFIEEIEGDYFPLLKRFALSPADSLSTLVEHYAVQIASVIRDFPEKEIPLILITGGGAYNTYFSERLDHYLGKKWQQFDANPELIEFKEALIFAFLGTLRLRGEMNCLSSVTGASRDSCGGTIYG